jgi:hypothetical protein
MTSELAEPDPTTSGPAVQTKPQVPLIAACHVFGTSRPRDTGACHCGARRIRQMPPARERCFSHSASLFEEAQPGAIVLQVSLT